MCSIFTLTLPGAVAVALCLCGVASKTDLNYRNTQPLNLQELHLRAEEGEGRKTAVREKLR